MKKDYPFAVWFLAVIGLIILGGSSAKAIVAGDPNGTPPDSPANRVIDNTDTSNPFAGVGSIDGFYSGFHHYGTATPITRIHVLTAAHVIDANANGVPDAPAGSFTFNINYGSSYSSVHIASAVVLHPNFTGYNNPSVNDDLAILTLSTPIPAGVPIYGLWTPQLSTGTTVSLVGYGTTGDGVSGYSGGPTLTIKRWGRNNIDQKLNDDESSGTKEVWKADFDGPTGSGQLGGSTLGNNVETTVGTGDSGAPGFYYDSVSQKYFLAATTTFTFTFGVGKPNPPLFGSGLGGMLIEPYVTWIDSVLAATVVPGDVDGDGFVGGSDLSIIMTNWGLTGASRQQGDLNGDTFVSGYDYTEVLTYWGVSVPHGGPEPLASIPEPATILLLAAVCTPLLCRRG